MGANQKSDILIEQEIKDSLSILSWTNRSFSDQSSYRLTYHRILLIEKGSGTLCIDDQAFHLTGKEIFLIAKGQLISFHANLRLTGFELSFGDSFWEKTPASANNCKARLFNNAAANQRLPVSGNDYKEINSLFDTLHKEFWKMEYINKLDAMAAYLKIIMIKIANVNASLIMAYESYENQIYRRFLELMSNHYKTIRDIPGYARQLGISTRKLTDACKQCSNKGPKEIMNDYIISEARRHLQFSAKPIKDIAYELNFHSPEQFSHFFKKYTDRSPKLYRNAFFNFGM